MPRVPYLDLQVQYRSIQSEVVAAVAEVCESGRFAQGPATKEFEDSFARFCGTKECVSLNSGTSALHLALRCLDVGPGDEVITVPFTFIATAWAISYVGARPVFVDIEPGRRTMDPDQLEAAITTRTRAIIPVHLYGMPAAMDEIQSIARTHRVPVVEDAAQAHGTRYKGRHVGQAGVAACFSFYPGKNLGAYGEGGALITDDPAIAVRTRALRDHAQSQRYHHDEIGYNYRMDSWQGAVLSVKLKRLDDWNARRRSHAAQYAELLAGLPCVLPTTFTDSECVWHCYVIEVEDRERIRARLNEAGIETGLHYPVPLHVQKAFADLGYRAGDFPVSERLARRCLSLPMYPELTEEQIRTVTSTIRSILLE